MSPVSIVVITVLCIGLYFVAFKLLVKLFFALHGLFYQTKGPGAIVWWILAMVVWVPVMILDVIHTTGCILLGIQVASALRSWWRKDSK